MIENDIVKIELLVEHSGNRKSKTAWNRIKEEIIKGVVDCSQCKNWNVAIGVHMMDCYDCKRFHPDLFELRTKENDE